MFKAIFSWFRYLLIQKCDWCGVKNVQLHSDGCGMMFCKECDKKDIKLFGHMRQIKFLRGEWNEEFERDV